MSVLRFLSTNRINVTCQVGLLPGIYKMFYAEGSRTEGVPFKKGEMNVGLYTETPKHHLDIGYFPGDSGCTCKMVSGIWYYDVTQICAIWQQEILEMQKLP
jgi:hypothetical protein